MSQFSKLGTMHPWVKQIQVCSNEGPLPFSKGNKNAIAKIHSQRWRSGKECLPCKRKVGCSNPSHDRLKS